MRQQFLRWVSSVSIALCLSLAAISASYQQPTQADNSRAPMTVADPGSGAGGNGG
jgi:hypothetical protein